MFVIGRSDDGWTGKLEMRFKKKRINNSRRIWNCELLPPESILEPICMNIKWEEIHKGSQHKQQGNLKLFKSGGIEDEDEDLPKSQYIGLSRHEFFDAMLSIVLTEHDHDAERQPLYALFDGLVGDHLDEYIYADMVELAKYMKDNEIVDRVKHQFRKNTALIKLFKKYASLDQEKLNNDISSNYLGEAEWSAMALELCKAAKSFNKNIWKNGGKPEMAQIVQCFSLSQRVQLLEADEISFVEFQRCLLYFTSSIFKNAPNAKYELLPFEKKLKLVMKWCNKLDLQKVKITSAGFTKSEQFKKIKRKRAQSTGSKTPRTPMTPSTHSVFKKSDGAKSWTVTVDSGNQSDDASPNGL